MRRRLKPSFSLLLAILLLSTLTLPMPIHGEGEKWLSGWKYRRKIYVENQGSTAISNYPVKIVIDTYTLIGQGKLRLDAYDLRFTDADGETILPYWFNSSTVNTFNTECYVRLSIPAGGFITIYMYYGNPNALDARDSMAKPEYPGMVYNAVKVDVEKSYTIPTYRPDVEVQSMLSTTYTSEVEWSAYATTWNLYAFSHMFRSGFTLPAGTYTFYVTALDSVAATWNVYLKVYRAGGTVETIASSTITIGSSLNTYSTTLSVPSPVNINFNDTLCLHLYRNAAYTSIKVRWDNGLTRLVLPQTIAIPDYGSVNVLYVSRPAYGYLNNLYFNGSSTIMAYNVTVTGYLGSNFPQYGYIYLYNSTNGGVIETLTWTETSSTTRSSQRWVVVDAAFIRGVSVSSSANLHNPFYITSLKVSLWVPPVIVENSTHETILYKAILKCVVRLKPECFPPSNPPVTWDNSTFKWLYPLLSYIVYYFAGDQTYTQQQSQNIITIPAFQNPTIIQNWFNVGFNWSLPRGNVTEMFRLLAGSELGRLSLTVLPLIFILIGGGGWGVVMVLASTGLALWIEYSIHDAYTIFNVQMLGVCLFIGVIGLFLRRRS